MEKIFILLSAVALFAIWKVAQKIIANQKHLSDEEFEKYMNSPKHITDQERSRFTQHLGTCSQCRDKMDVWIKGDK